jgi:RecB family endonuclease NucS
MNISLWLTYKGRSNGNIDEKVRHAITKLADYHFVASENAKKESSNWGRS